MRATFTLLTLLLASTASALSSQYTEWRNGPIQWIMTNAEKKAWKQVTTDEAASDFIDLFWVRRDPTAGTAENEARDEFDARVRVADEKYAERDKRGALTDRGRALVVLGPPPNMSDILSRIGHSADAYVAPSSIASGGKGQSEPITGKVDPAGGRQLGEREVWIWEHADASARFGMPRVEIVFVTDPLNHRTIRDVFRRDFGAAESVALKNQIKQDYQTLPNWAAIGGLTPRRRGSAKPEPTATATVAVATPAAPAAAGAAPVVMAPRGATRLTVTRNAFDATPQTGDPFATLPVVDRFKATEDLGWAAQYCGQSDQQLSVPFIVRITGGPDDHRVNMATPRDEIAPDRIPAAPGCYMLRGAIPLEALSAGKYTLHVMIDDPIVKGDSYDLTHEFAVE